jgi:hypothetical protein
VRPALTLSLFLALAAACGDDGGSDTVDGAVDADAAPADAAGDSGPDAFVRCPGEVFFTGEYIDWDSTLTAFDGVENTDVTERGNPTNTDETSPNGRFELCVASGTDGDFDLTQPDDAYLPLIYARDEDGGTPTIRGVKPARAATLFSNELALTQTAGAALVLVDVRTSAGPVVGATVSIGATNDGGFHFDDQMTMTAGATTTADGGLILFANAAVGAGTTTVTVTPPGGTSCVGRQEIPVVADTISATTFECD